METGFCEFGGILRLVVLFIGEYGYGGFDGPCDAAGDD